jgi:ankyrin repeat protein
MGESTQLMNLPPELWCKIYKNCDTRSLLNFGEAYPKFMAEIIRYHDDLEVLWFKSLRSINISIDWIKSLLKAGINPNLRDDEKLSDLLYITCRGDMYITPCDRLDIVKALIDAGANLNARNCRNETALQLAIDNEKFDIAKILIIAGADVNKQDRFRLTALHHASKRGNLSIMKMLIEAGADLNTQRFDGLTALHQAVYSKYLDGVKTLIEAGADLNAQNRYGQTALHVAAAENHIDIVKMLIEAGANPQIQLSGTANAGAIPLDLAIMHRHSNIVKYLKKLKWKKSLGRWGP